jgi:hypothetical protein
MAKRTREVQKGTNRAWVGTNRDFWDESGAGLGRIGRANLPAWAMKNSLCDLL